MNVQARELELGSGGFDVLYANLTRGLELAPEQGAHVMVLPYTPLQHARLHVEETGELDAKLRGLPVVCCSVHSQVAPACAGLAGLRVAYVQLAGGALPVSLSDTVRALRERGLVRPPPPSRRASTRTCSASRWPRRSPGHGASTTSPSARSAPGSSAPGSRFGHGGLAAAEAANAALALGGVPVIAARVSARTSGRATAASRITPKRCSRSCPASRASRRTARAGARPARACRSRTWVAGPDDDPTSSPPPTPRGSRLAGWRVMEERRLGPVVGLGTWNTFGGDAELGAPGGLRPRSKPARGSSTRRRCTAARRRPRRSARGQAGRGGRRDQDLVAVGGRGAGALRAAARVVRPGRRRAGAQPGRVAASTCRGSSPSATRAGSAGWA